MADAKLVLHCGAREVDREQLALVPTPAATATWFPVAHSTVIDTVQQSLTDAGFEIRKASYGLSRNDARMFATFDLQSLLAEGVALAVGIRNSIDKSFPLGFFAGSKCFVCDNMALRSELLVKRKHTAHGLTRFQEAICQAVGGLKQFQQNEAERIEWMRGEEIDDTKAESLILRSYEKGIVSHRALPKVLEQWREPSYPDFAARSVWSLLNAFTSALGGRRKSAPQVYASQTMRLFGLIDDNFPQLRRVETVAVEASNAA